MWGSVGSVLFAARQVGALQGSGTPGYRKIVLTVGIGCRRLHPRVPGGAGALSGQESPDRSCYRSDVGPGNTAERRPCLPVLAKGCFRFKAVSGSDLGKRFGSDLMTDTRGVFKDSEVSVQGFQVRPPIT
jgi:hypothetical protein